ncbi:hypothetical protein BKA61DRAFT_669850 [Leptodontidium sp. MPI-SDFR-AT-0119]|nr:hypothetical protein BKA61DRAFT_669850 [Leptodontidium sp. MPI-SDFR-AT-0119]
MTDGDTSSLESKDSEYVDDEVETDNKGVKHIDVGVRDINGGESDKARSEGEAIGIGYESLIGGGNRQ